MDTYRHSLRVICILLVATPLLLPAPATAGPPTIEENHTEFRSLSQQSGTGNVTVTLSRESEREIRADFEINDRPEDLHISGPPGFPGLNWTQLHGFKDPTWGDVYWNTSELNPRASYSFPTKPIDEGPLGINRPLYFDKGSWTFAPSVVTKGANATREIRPEGTVIGEYVYFGSYKEKTEEIRGQRIRLIRTSGSGLNMAWSTKMLNATSSYVRFGTTPKTLPIIGLPTDIDHYSGLAITARGNPSWIIVVEKPSLGRTTSVYRTQSPITLAHEYLHTWQTDWVFTSDARWLREAVPNYYAVESLYRGGVITDETYRAFWTRHRSRIDGEAVLSNTSSWSDSTPYSRGAFVLAGLDERIRNVTNGSSSLQTVLQRVDHEGRTTLEDVNSTIEDVADSGTAAWFSEHVESSKLPAKARDTSGSLFHGTLWTAYSMVSRLPIWGKMLFVIIFGLLLAESVIGLAEDGMEKYREFSERDSS